ncbi:hypothetical protein FB567DRAFT_589388 [Paraphoma chrysanthemicola]|uniref:Uncharacterized protein n=1 Tax=Paraphoma chrysanthemicola TaxID=798071 RepID=A0A8K0W210_9PLEO|nr:hypothetical protein FB567DRAFT_589388 [Paraphoma chrysanthemicola]
MANNVRCSCIFCWLDLYGRLLLHLFFANIELAYLISRYFILLFLKALHALALIVSSSLYVYPNSYINVNKLRPPQRVRPSVIENFRFPYYFKTLWGWLSDRAWAEFATVHIIFSYARPYEQELINAIIRARNINMEEYWNPYGEESHGHLEDFFLRRFRYGARPPECPKDWSKAVTMVEVTLSIFKSLQATKESWTESCRSLHVKNVLEAEHSWACDFGDVACFFVDAHQCHYFHSPIHGEIKEFHALYGTSSRCECHSRSLVRFLIESPTFGSVVVLIFGQNADANIRVSKESRFLNLAEWTLWFDKGDELGSYCPGVLFVVVAFEKGKVTFDERWTSPSQSDLTEQNGHNLGTPVECKLGQTLCRVVGPPSPHSQQA